MPKKQIELLARGVLIRDEQLLVCRTGEAEIVYLPGGHVEFGETARAALDREIAEELGCAASAGRFLGAIQNTFIQSRRRHWEINLIFEMTVGGLVAGAAPVSREKHLSFEWVALDSLAAARLEPAVLGECLVAWLRGADLERWQEPSTK